MIRDWDPYLLSPRERRIVGALACGLYDPCGIGIASGKLDVSLADVVDDVETWLGTPHPVLRAVFRALLISIEVSPIRFGFGPCTMSALPLDRLAAYVAALDAAG